MCVCLSVCVSALTALVPRLVLVGLAVLVQLAVRPEDEHLAARQDGHVLLLVLNVCKCVCV